MNYKPWKVGLMQAVGLILYVLLFATIVFSMAGKPDPSPFIAITIFLLAFIISATVCGTIGLFYPIKLFMQQRAKEALQVIAWNVAWLLIFFLIVVALTFV